MNFCLHVFTVCFVQRAAFLVPPMLGQYQLPIFKTQFEKKLSKMFSAHNERLKRTNLKFETKFETKKKFLFIFCADRNRVMIFDTDKTRMTFGV